MQNLNMPVRCSSRRPKHASGSTFCSQGSWLSPSRHYGLSVVLCSWGLCRPRLASLGETCAQSEVGPRSFMSMSRDPGPAPAQTLCAHWNALIGKTPKSWYFSEFAAFWSLQCNVNSDVEMILGALIVAFIQGSHRHFQSLVKGQPQKAALGPTPQFSPRVPALGEAMPLARVSAISQCRNSLFFSSFPCCQARRYHYHKKVWRLWGCLDVHSPITVWPVCLYMFPLLLFAVTR